MIKGIGVDTADIAEIARFCRVTPAFLTHTFTPAEQRVAASMNERAAAEYLAVRFAAKEAVFKALAHAPGVAFDLRRVETLNHEDGAPYVEMTPEVEGAMRAAGADAIHISATTEGNFATVFVVAESREG